MTWLDYTSLRQQMTFEGVLTHYGFEVNRTNGNALRIVCPFHDDHKPSCTIDIERKIFNCFSCQTGGNILDFVTRMEGFDPNKEIRKGALFAVKTFDLKTGDLKTGQAPKGANRTKTKSEARPQVRAKARNGLRRDISSEDVANETSDEVGAQTKPEASTDSIQSSKANVEAKQSNKDQGQSQEGKKAESNPPLSFALKLQKHHAFLEERGISDDMLETFGVGYCHKGMFKGRICFPIHNEAGDLIAYSGRWPEADLPENEPRYKLPPGFHKRFVLFNLHAVLKRRTELAKADEALSNTVVIVEGFWSVIRLHTAGVPVVSCFGASLSTEQVDLLVEAGFNQVVLIFDGDEGGRKGIELAVPLLSDKLFVRTIHLEDGDKPDTMDEDLIDQLPRFVL